MLVFVALINKIKTFLFKKKEVSFLSRVIIYFPFFVEEFKYNNQLCVIDGNYLFNLWGSMLTKTRKRNIVAIARKKILFEVLQHT